MSKVIEIQEQIQNTLRTEVRNVMKSESEAIKKVLEDLKKAGPSNISHIEELKTEIKGVQYENNELRTQITEMIKTVSQLNVNLNVLDQTMREANIEIYGLPELKNENLIAIVIKLASVVSYKLQDSDILKCIRVPNSRLHPHSVVVKLCSVRCRNDFYAAIIRYNKSRPDDRLNTTVLGFGGRKVPVYVTEHRSPLNKS
ncbi:hypothetical protein PYW07_010667 [Mythimna separata]|uniref:Uncharacterized protein n=1 Tax=Mythimna separata TaxID=271217 RepID=A0AAD7Y823_MYTSE|nr:hypothetical protein PYW07_010667 [Mythimna separata]